MPETTRHEETSASPQRREKKRVPRRINRGYLERAALFYLDRYASSVENLRRVLRRKAARSRAHHEEDGSGDEALIQTVIERLLELDAVDDRRFAEAMVRRLRPRGASTRLLRARLRAKGIGGELCDEVLGEDDAEVETEAARSYARRRRLGPHRLDAELRAEHRQRDLAAMARAGYSFAVASRVLTTDPDD
jgi:regulatory protein